MIWNRCPNGCEEFEYRKLPVIGQNAKTWYEKRCPVCNVVEYVPEERMARSGETG